MIVGVVSYKGGVGKTTVTSNLAMNLRRLTQTVSAIDLDDQNALRLHFGLPFSLQKGIAMYASPEDWRHVARMSTSGVMVYPYGHVSAIQRLQFQQQLEMQNSPLSVWLKNMRGNELVLIDTPPGDNPAVRETIRMADILLVILNTDGASFATIGLIDELVRTYRPQLLYENKMHYLLTDYDERSSMERAVYDAVRRVCAERLAPLAIHHDTVLKEAFVSHALLNEYNKNSQVLWEFERLSQWLLSKFKQGTSQ